MSTEMKTTSSFANATDTAIKGSEGHLSLNTTTKDYEIIKGRRIRNGNLYLLFQMYI